MSENFYAFLFYSLLLTSGVALIIFLIRYYVFKPEATKKYPKLSKIYLDENNKQLYISYDLPEKTCIKIAMEDFNGKTIQIFVDEEKNEGFYTLEYDASNLVKGEYFITITTQKMNASKKFLIQ